MQKQNPQQFNVENQQAGNFYQEYQQPIYSSADIKKKFNPAVIIVPAVILVMAAAVLLILLLSGKAGYKAAEGKFISQMFSGLSSALSESEKVSREPQSLSVSFEASNSQISDYIGISEISFTTDTAVNGEDIYARMCLAAGDRLFNGSLWFDSENSNVLMILPEISSVYLQTSVAAGDDVQNLNIDSEKAVEALKDIVAKTLETYFEVVGDPKTESGQTFLVNNVTYTADKTVIRLDSAQLASVVRTFFDSLVNSDDAMDILCSYYGASKEEVLEMLNINDAIEELNEFIENGADSAASFEMAVWMQGSNIVGREVEITNDDGDTAVAFDFYKIPSSDGNVTYFKTSNGFECFNDDKVSGELHSGTITMSYLEAELTVEYKDIAITDQLFQGEAKVVVTGAEAFEIKAELKTEGDDKTMLISVPNVCRITVTAKPSELSYEDMPQLSADQVAIIDRDGDFYEDEAFNQFMNDVFEFIFGSYMF